jgi:hypothetical protein
LQLTGDYLQKLNKVLSSRGLPQIRDRIIIVTVKEASARNCSRKWSMIQLQSFADSKFQFELEVWGMMGGLTDSADDKEVVESEAKVAAVAHEIRHLFDHVQTSRSGDCQWRSNQEIGRRICTESHREIKAYPMENDGVKHWAGGHAKGITRIMSTRIFQISQKIKRHYR